MTTKTKPKPHDEKKEKRQSVPSPFENKPRNPNTKGAPDDEKPDRQYEDKDES